MTTIPQDWFMGKDHEMSKIAWLLYDHQEKLEPEFLGELLSLLIELESESLLEVGGFVPRIEDGGLSSEEKAEIHEQACKNIIMREQERWLQKQKEAKKKKAKDAPLLAMADGEIKSPSPCIYDYMEPYQAEYMVNLEVARIQLSMEHAALRKTQDETRKKEKKTKKSNKKEKLIKPKKPKKKVAKAKEA